MKLLAFCAVVLLAGVNANTVETKEQLRLAMLHGVPAKWDLETNFKAFLEGVEQADQEGADIFITPECWLDGYAAPDKESTPERLRGIAQDLAESPYLKRVSEEAHTRGMQICFGFTSIEHGDIFNTSGLWNEQGELTGVYHKTHLQTHDLQYSFGEALPVWKTSVGTVGMMICADRRWPETVRVLRLQGARLVLNPTYGFHGDLNTAILRTRAFENQCFIAFTHPQESLVTGPGGKIVAQWTGDTPGVMVCDIDLSEAKEDNHLRDRRPDIYSVLTATSGNEQTAQE